MTKITVAQARREIFRLVDQVTSTREPVVITGKKSNALLISEEEWDSMQETLYLLSIPGMGDSIRQGLNEDLNDCSQKLDW